MRLNQFIRFGLFTGTVIAIAASTLMCASKPLPECRSMLLERANKLTKKMIMPNDDGGAFLLSEGTGPSTIAFIGFVGPVTAQTLFKEMISVGLLDVSVSITGQCVTSSGLEYTVVQGNYRIKQPPVEEPSEPI